MPDTLRTIYSNVINIRLTPGEFVLEFGAHFPDRPGHTPPSDYRPEMRVVLPAPAIQGMLQALNQAVQQLQAKTATTQSRQALGFQKPNPEGAKDKP